MAGAMRYKLIFILAPITVGVAAFFGVRALLEVTVSQPRLLQQEYPQIAEDVLKQRFEGELLGIYLAPSKVLAQRGIQIYVDKLCPSGFDVVPGDAYAPPAPKYLPPGTYQPPTYEALATEPNPAATICRDNGRLYTAWRVYKLPPTATGLEGEILIERYVLPRPYRSTDAPRDRIEVLTVGGRPAIVIKPLVPEGGTVASVTNVIFPEPGGYTVIQAQVVSFTEVMKVAESLGEALK